jgi:hypothetical protein
MTGILLEGDANVTLFAANGCEIGQITLLSVGNHGAVLRFQPSEYPGIEWTPMLANDGLTVSLKLGGSDGPRLTNAVVKPARGPALGLAVS